MRKRRYLLEYRCNKISVNIINRISSCNEKDNGNRCDGCVYKEEVDHSKKLKVNDFVVEGNRMVSQGKKREDVIEELKKKYNLDKSQMGKIKRNLNYVFKKVKDAGINADIKDETKRCGNCCKFTKCGKTGFMELVNCSGWSS